MKATRLLATACLAVSALAAATEPLEPLPAQEPQDMRRVELGRQLFQDKRLSGDDSVACVSCHRFDHGGADPRPFSVGAHGRHHVVNTPSVWNASYNFRQQWSGGASTMESMISQVIRNPLAMDSNWPQVMGKLSRDPALVAAFRAAYPGGLSPDAVTDAIAVYQRTLAAPSRFDRYLRGDRSAIDADEARGYELFKAYGCVGCHQGMNVGGNMYQRFGVMADYFAARAAAGRPPTAADNGRFNATHRPEDMHVFKVPSLRNVTLTAPYFHDASAATLEDAVTVMLRYQVGRDASPQDKALIIRFLGTLEGAVTP